MKEKIVVKENAVCAFTGHRDLESDFSERKLLKLIKESLKSGVFTYLCGMAMGFDMKAAELLLSLKKKYPQIQLIACLPCLEQDKYFSEKDKQRYAALLEKADNQILLSQRYFRGCMQKRDKYMADNADMMIAYCNRDTGGTAYTVKCFEKAHPDGVILFV